MRPPLVITSADNPRVKRIVHLRKPRDRREAGVLVAEGLREVSRAIDAGLTLLELFWSPDLSGVSRDAIVKALPKIERSRASVYEVTPALLKKMTYRDEPEGWLAVFEQPRWTLDALAPDGPDLWLVASGTEKPGNLGAMARSAEAAGASGLLCADAEVDLFNPNAIRASTGAVFTLPAVSAPSDQILRFLRSRNARPIVATPDARQDYTSIDLRGPVAVVIGAEDRGVDEHWRTAAAQHGVLVRIPMQGRTVDSLNASVTAALLLFEAVRQRRG